MKPKKEMIRVVLTPEGEILLDATGKKNGRGAYVCKNKECLKAAIRNKGLSRSLKTNISEEIFSVLEKEMDSLG